MSDFFSILFLIALIFLAAFSGEKKHRRPQAHKKAPPHSKAPPAQPKRTLDYMLQKPPSENPFPKEEGSPAPAPKDVPSPAASCATPFAPSTNQVPSQEQTAPSWRAAFISSVIFGPPRSRQNNYFKR